MKFTRSIYQNAVALSSFFVIWLGSVSGCSDKSPIADCLQHRQNGYCDPLSPYYLLAKTSCRKTCGACACVDVQPTSYCNSWKASGFCDKRSTWHSFMSDNCAGTCEMCKNGPSTPSPVAATTASSACQDENSYCSTYKDYCTDPNYITFVQKSCKRTCNYCHITTTRPTTTAPPMTTPYIVPGGSENFQPGCGLKGPSHTRIVGGKQAGPGEWPWLVTFDSKHNTVNPGHHCGGTILNDEWILSAAHCFATDTDPKSYWLTIGEHDLKKSDPNNEQRIPIEKILIHPNYTDSSGHDFDLALVKLRAKMRVGNRARAACLPDHNTTFSIGKKCFIVGWGLLAEFGDRAQILQEATVPLIGRGTCQRGYDQLNYRITHRMLCAGHSKGGIDSCEGDSGGPMVCEGSNGLWYLWGVISWGVGCARQGFYGVYANTKVMRPWIDSHVFPNGASAF